MEQVVRFPQLIGLHGSFFSVMKKKFEAGESMELFDDEYRSILSVNDAVELLFALFQRVLEKSDVDLSRVWHIGGTRKVR